MEKSFKAMVVSEAGNKQYRREIVQRQIRDLPEGDVLVKVYYSSLNYKDALSAYRCFITWSSGDIIMYGNFNKRMLQMEFMVHRDIQACNKKNPMDRMMGCGF